MYVVSEATKSTCSCKFQSFPGGACPLTPLLWYANAHYNLPLNESTHICSEHFNNSRGRKRKSEVLTPALPTQVTPTSSHRQLIQHALLEHTRKLTEPKYADATVNTDVTFADIEALEGGVSKVKDQLQQSEQALQI